MSVDTVMTSFVPYEKPEQNHQRRQTACKLAENRSAPHATDLHAPHVSCAYGGQEAEALAGCIISDCLSESQAESDAGVTTTKVVRENTDWILHGPEKWITDAGVSTYSTDLAVTDPIKGTRVGISIFLVDSADEGVSPEALKRKQALKGVLTGEVYLNNVRVGSDRVIGEIGTDFALAMGTIDHTRITVEAQASGSGALHAAAQHLLYVAAATSEREDDDLTVFWQRVKLSPQVLLCE